MTTFRIVATESDFENYAQQLEIEICRKTGSSLQDKQSYAVSPTRAAGVTGTRPQLIEQDELRALVGNRDIHH